MSTSARGEGGGHGRHEPRANATIKRSRNRRGEGARLRDELLEAARHLLSGAGAESELTIRGVTRAAGVHPQAFYLHFKSLDELLYDVYAAEFSELTDALRAARAGVDDGPAALRAVCHEYVRFALSQPARYRLLMSVQGQPHPDWSPLNLPGTPALQVLIDAVKSASPHDRDGYEVVRPTLLLWATLHGLVALRVNRPTFPWPPVEELVDAAVEAATSHGG